MGAQVSGLDISELDVLWAHAKVRTSTLCVGSWCRVPSSFMVASLNPWHWHRLSVGAIDKVSEVGGGGGGAQGEVPATQDSYSLQCSDCTHCSDRTPR
jgi:hypothetical protein